MLGADGTVYGFGDAKNYGDLRDPCCAQLSVDLEPTPSGNGYWVITSIGGVYNYGDAVGACKGPARPGPNPCLSG
jgi:hypothetical protein